MYFQMDYSLELCKNIEEKRHKLKKLDKRLRYIYNNLAQKAMFIVVFTGSSLKVPEPERSNGFVMLNIKDDAKRNLL